MLRYLGIVVLVIFFTHGVLAQDVSGSHDVQPGSELNEYNVKTTIKGLKGVDIARIKYVIDNKHTYKASPNNPLFSDRNEQYIKFYIMAVPPTGILTIELGIVIADGADYAFPVEFQYSRNEEKQTLNLPLINLSGGEAIAAIVEEESEVIEVPEPVVPLVVEEEPEIIETPEPIAPPVVEEEPEVIETPEPIAPPVVEEEPEVIETPEPIAPPVVEEEPEVIEASEPVTPTASVSRSSTKFTVQILSLSNFSQSRLNTYCKKHNLPVNKVSKRNVGSMVKITYGEANSVGEAKKLKEQLARDYGINESFVTSIK